MTVVAASDRLAHQPVSFQAVPAQARAAPCVSAVLPSPAARLASSAFLRRIHQQAHGWLRLVAEKSVFFGPAVSVKEIILGEMLLIASEIASYIGVPNDCRA